MKKMYQSLYFKRSFIMHIYIYILPIIILLIMITNSLTHFLQTEIENNTKMHIEKALKVIDDNISVMNNIVTDMYNNETLFLNPRIQDTYSQMQINRALKEYSYMDTFYNEIIFYYHHIDLVFTTAECDSRTKFFETSYHFVDVDDQTIDDWLTGAKKQTLIPVNRVVKYGKQEKDLILYVVPLNNREPNATVIFVIDNRWFYDTFESLCDKYEALVSFYSYNDELITSVSSDKYDDESLGKHIPIEMTSDSHQYYIKANISRGIMFEALYSVYGIIVVYVAGLLVLGWFLILYLTRRAYIPIMNLKYFFEKEMNPANDDIEIIRSGIEKMENLNHDLQCSLREQKYKLKCRILKDILNFNHNEDETNAIFEERDENGQKILQRIIFLIHKNTANVSYGDLLYNSNDLTIYQLESEYDSVEIFLVRYSQDTEERLEEFLQAILKEIGEKTGEEVHFIIGKAVDDVFDIRHSFLSAENAYYEREKNGMIFANEEKYISRYPSEELKKFEKALDERRMSDAMDMFTSIKACVFHSPIHLFMKKCIIFGLYTAFINTSAQYDDSTGINFIQSMLDKHGLLETNDFRKIFEEFQMHINILSDKLAHMGNSDLVKNCCNYINTHFFEYDLSVLNIADKLNVSVNLLNHQMKMEIQMTVNDYISYIRMENAKYMLANSQLSINTIVKYIGYIDVSSFGRKFKSQTGMSLTQYRKHCGRRP